MVSTLTTLIVYQLQCANPIRYILQHAKNLETYLINTLWYSNINVKIQSLNPYYELLKNRKAKGKSHKPLYRFGTVTLHPKSYWK